MATAERPEGQPNPENSQTLEQLFTTPDQAGILIFDIGSNQEDTLHAYYRGSLSESEYCRLHSPAKIRGNYMDLFGRKGRISAPQERRHSNWDYTSEYGEPNDSWRIRNCRVSEAFRATEFLFSPSKDPEQIRRRQELLEQLAELPNLDQLITLKNRTYNLIAGVHDIRGFLYTCPCHDVNPSLIDLYYEGEKKMKICNSGDDEWSPEENPGEYDILALVSESVDLINDGLGGIGDFARAAGESSSSSLREAMSDLPGFIKKVRKDLKPIIPFDKAEDPGKDHWHESDRLDWAVQRDGVEPRLFKLGAVLEIAKKIRDEGWGKVTFDQDKPYGYTGGWSLDLPKDKQVHNDGPYEAPIVVLSGANTSGKSFAMNSDFVIRMMAQSIGFTPVINGNLPLSENFVYLERVSTDADNDLSAFMREVKNWIIALDSVGDATRLYVDEGYSTTSPQDQARLLTATADYAKGRGGSVMLATHNDVLLSLAADNPNMAVYHLEVEIGENGRLVRKYNLLPGVNESFALAAARAGNFSAEVIAGAEEYLGREMGVVETALDHEYPKVIPLTEEERAALKLKAKDLGFLFPGNSGYSLLSLFSRDADFDTLKLLKHFNSDEPARFHAHGDGTSARQMLGEMILWTPGLLPADILERQKMFAELVRNNNFRELQEAIGRTWYLEEMFAVISSHMAEGIGLNPFRKEVEAYRKQVREAKRKGEKKNFERPFNSYDDSIKIQAAIAFLRIQQKVLGDSFKDGELLEVFIRLSGETKDGYLPRGEGNDLEGLIFRLARVDDALISAPLAKIDLDEIHEELVAIGKIGRFRKTKEDPEKAESMLEELVYGSGLALALGRIQSDLENAGVLIAKLRGTDSVYLHLVANHLQQRLDRQRAVLRGEAHEKTAPTKELAKQILIKGMQDTIFGKTLRQLDAICLFADMIQEKALSPVEFNDTGELKLANAFSLFKDKDEQIRNSVDMSPGNERVELLTGPNGSGKTFYEKDVCLAILMALATGYAPADNATMPVFDGVTYLDRVVGRDDLSLSAFAQDMEYWKKLLRLLDTKKAVFTAVDEAFSSTSPAYQAALTYGVIGEVLRRKNHFLMLSTHNHELVDRLRDVHAGLARPYHFNFRTKDGKVEFLYKKQEGHETSHAIEVARTMGLPEEITELATTLE